MLRTPDSTHGPFHEGTTPVFQATVTDELGQAIPGSALNSMTVTLFNELTGVIINSRDHYNILSLVSGAGLLSWRLAKEDMVILDVTRVEERHRALFEWTYDSSQGYGKHEARILVSNLLKVPA